MFWYYSSHLPACAYVVRFKPLLIYVRQWLNIRLEACFSLNVDPCVKYPSFQWYIYYFLFELNEQTCNVQSLAVSHCWRRMLPNHHVFCMHFWRLTQKTLEWTACCVSLVLAIPSSWEPPDTCSPSNTADSKLLLVVGNSSLEPVQIEWSLTEWKPRRNSISSRVGTPRFFTILGLVRVHWTCEPRAIGSSKRRPA